jgi:hypothetical protein
MNIQRNSIVPGRLKYSNIPHSLSIQLALGQGIKENELKDMSGKWYRSRTIQAAFITGAFVLLGTIISLFWLRGSKKPQIETSKSISETPSDVGTNRTSPISLQIIPNVSREKMDSVLVAMRRSQQLRELTPLETGKSVSETPSGTFFFVPYIYLKHAEGRLSEMSQQGEVIARVEYVEYRRFYFEVHYVSEGMIFLVVFVSSESATEISRLDGTTNKHVTLSPLPWDGIETLVFLPLDRIVEARDREIQTRDSSRVCVLDVIVQ